MIEIYTDGAHNPALGKGGWAAIIVEDGKKRALAGFAEKTTNNRMEITAALEGLLQTPPGAEATIYTDSQYLFGCMTQGWQRKANLDLLSRLDAIVSERKAHWKWIEGDNGNPFHKEAHNLATDQASHGGGPPETEGPPGLTHIDAEGRPRMVDVTKKPETEREAIARGAVIMKPATFELIKKGGVAKGDVLTVAQLAGIMATKQTATLIPLCHTILIGDARVEFNLDEKNSTIGITATVKSTGKTGVEMEAMTAVAVAALTIYDMCKAVDRAMRLTDIRLVKKSGGKSGTINLES